MQVHSARSGEVTEVGEEHRQRGNAATWVRSWAKMASAVGSGQAPLSPTTTKENGYLTGVELIRSAITSLRRPLVESAVITSSLVITLDASEPVLREDVGGDVAGRGGPVEVGELHTDNQGIQDEQMHQPAGPGFHPVPGLAAAGDQDQVSERGEGLWEKPSSLASASLMSGCGPRSPVVSVAGS
jgi:hypothetical protein